VREKVLDVINQGNANQNHSETLSLLDGYYQKNVGKGVEERELLITTHQGLYSQFGKEHGGLKK
jgi:hypothetical protein